tara:strand:- start:2449 stop:3198 length:750 start_codon:yes stop_codon:yes gene_type:complete
LKKDIGNMKNKLITIIFLVSIYLNADNEIYVQQTGSNASIDIEQLGSSNLIGGTEAIFGTMTSAILNGSTMTLDLNQIGSSNKFITGGILGSNFTGTFDFTGDSNVFDIDFDTTGLNVSDYANLNVDVTGSSNEFTLDIANSAEADYLDLDWIILGDSNEFDFDINYSNATNYVDVNGSSNSITFSGSGYSGVSASDSGYFYLDLDGSSNTFNITQASTLAQDWLKITSNGSNNNICIIQNDGGMSTSC